MNPVEEILTEKNEIDADQKNTQEEFVKISIAKFNLIQKHIEKIEGTTKQLKNLMGLLGAEEPLALSFELKSEKSNADQGKIVEGVFDGEKMIGADGESYKVPVNYASKSKLVEGDILKLTITTKGLHLFKQIGPIERTRMICQLAEDELGNFWAIHSSGRKWRILSASVTYFKCNPGDEIIVLVPKEGSSRWAAVENIGKKW